MKFTQISESAFREFAEKSPHFSFMQTPEIAQLRAKTGWHPYYFAVTEDPGPPKSNKTPKTSKSPAKSTTSTPNILAASLVLARPTFLGYQTFYAPGGPLLDPEDRELADFFFTHLVSFARSHHAYVLHIDPYYELIERDRDGKIVENGISHESARQNLISLGFRPQEDTTMPRYLFALDFATDVTSPNPQPTKNRTKTEQKPNKTTIAPKSSLPTPDTVFAQFKQNTRNLIHRCERQGITVRELTREELPILKQITASTSARRHFTDQPLSYYQAMYDLFSPRGEVKFLLAELPAPKGDSNPKSGSKSGSASTPTPDSPSTPTPLSVAMFMLVGHEVVYLYSGSDVAFMKHFNAQYLIQWHMIKYALEHGFARYNFYGIQGLPDPSSKGYGIYRFKKGFGGHVIELIGSFELPISRPIYRLHSLLSHLKSLLHH